MAGDERIVIGDVGSSAADVDASSPSAEPVQPVAERSPPSASTGNPFDLSGVHPLLRALVGPVTRFGLLRRYYDDWLASGQRGSIAFIDYCFQVLGVGHQLHGAQHLDALPAQGPALVVANHPLGAIEGLLITRLLLERRPDTRVLTNDLLLRIPEFSQVFIGVDILGLSAAAQQRNARALREASRHLEAGGLLMMFPAGTVSRISWTDWRLRDVAWNQLAGRLAQRHRAPCLPLYVSGRNRRRFYLSGLISTRLRTALLPRAMLGLRGRSFALHLNGPARRLPEGLSAAASTDLLRLAVEVQAPVKKRRLGKTGAAMPLAPGPDLSAVSAQLQALEGRCVHRRGNHAVYLVPYAELGCLGDHLAREREATFRLVGEGTGRAADHDRFDRSHQHILVWDHCANALVGGYRVADAKALVDAHGVDALYSASLYRLAADFLQGFAGAMEVGRSFVTPAYQADLHALDLLWCGLGAFVRAHPHCHTFFGCVSISASYPPLLRSLMTRCLLGHHGVAGSAQPAPQALAPYRPAEPTWSPALENELSTVSALNQALAAIHDSYRVPVMIRHYLALGGRFHNFALNRGFNQAVDGLVSVDLRHSPDRYLRRYMGAEGAPAFQQRWAIAP